MKHYNSPNLVRYSQTLRKEMTPQERHLWYDYFKKLPLNVNRQKVILDYIVDFYIHQKRIAIELDGSQHYTQEHLEYDSIRDKRLGQLGITVLRYSNIDVDYRFESVCSDISKWLGL